MIKFVTGDILKSEAECLVNTVNCEGYMGKGIAYQFKLAYPNNNKNYVLACKSGQLTIGRLHYYRENEKCIVNFPTKNKWRAKSDIAYIKKGLIELKKLIFDLNIKSIAIPPLGCGNGGLNWQEVKSLITSSLEDTSKDVDIYIYEPSQYYKPDKISSVPNLNVSHLIIMTLKPVLKSFTKLYIQKCAFFLNTMLGQQYFVFQKHKLGPYSHAIDIIIKDIKEYQAYYGVSTKEAFRLARNTLISKNVEDKYDKFLPYIKKSVDLVNSVNTPHELELLSTITFIVMETGQVSKENIYKQIQDWSDEKAIKFNSMDELEKALELLLLKGILVRDMDNKYLLLNEIKS